MSFKYLVFIKQVPDTKNITGEGMKEDGTVNRSALPAIFNPDDQNALEMALQLKERFGGSVTVCTMGPPTAAEALRQALYIGADEAALLTDRKFAGADTLATSYALSCAAKKFGDSTLVLCGRQAIDGDTAQVGPQLAEKLALPQMTYVQEVLDLTESTVRARCEIEGGHEVVEGPTPLLMTVVGGANVPRPPSAKRLMQYKKAVTPTELRAANGDHAYEDANQLAEQEQKLRDRGCWIHEWSAENVGAATERIGLAGSPTKVKKIESVKLTGHEYKDIPPTKEGVRSLVHELVQEHILS